MEQQAERSIWNDLGSALSAFAWPAALWGLAFFFHAGMTGPRSDDWFFSFISPVTGESHRYIISTWTTTHYRPLHHIFVPFLATAFAGLSWLGILVASLSHATAAILLWKVMCAIGIDRRAAQAAATLWMLYPVLFEVPLWLSASSTSVATSVALAVLLFSLKYVRHGPTWAVPLVALGSYTCCAFNEQPAAAFAAVPILALFAQGTTTKSRVCRTAAIMVAASLGVGVYLAITMGLTPWIAEGQPDRARGSASRLVRTIGELEGRWNRTKDGANEIMWMPGMFRASVAHGIATLGRGPRHLGWVWATPWVLVLGTAGWMTARSQWNRIKLDESEAAQAQSHGRRIAQILFGTTVCFAGFVPILITRDLEMQTRYAYVPAVGLAIGVAAVLDAAITFGSWRARTRTLAVQGIFFGMVPLVWAIATLGIQDGLYRRVVQDRREASQLRDLIPNPPPDAVIIIVRTDFRVTASGSEQFDRLFPGATNITWATSDWARQAFGRWDIWAAPAHAQLRGPVLEVSDNGVRIQPDMMDTTRLPPGVDGDSLYIPWSRAVPVAIDPEGDLDLVTAFDVGGRIVLHPSLKSSTGRKIEIPVRPRP